MINKPLVSIIIPCYNYEKYIEKCIQSVLDQTYKNIELIVVDNGSTDNSLKKINTFKNNPKIKIIKLERNIPPGTIGNSAFKVAFEASKGEYVGILYADDWYLPDKIKKQMDLFNRSASSVGVVYCHGYRYFEKTKTKSEWRYQSVRGYVFKDYLLKGDVVIPISPLVKRYCYKTIGLNNVWTGSEYDFLLMSQYVDFDFVDDNLVVMREHRGNDAKNIHSVYQRVKSFHTKALLTGDAKSREGRLVERRVAMDYLAYGLNFMTRLDMKYAKVAIFDAIRLYPLYIFKPKLLMSLFLLFLPLNIAKYFLKNSGKIHLFEKEIHI